MATRKLKTKVVSGILIRLTFDGAFQRAKIYAKSIPEEKRKALRKYITFELPKTLRANEKRKQYSDKDHYNTIRRFSDHVTEAFKNMLEQKRFRIGNAQKFINLYWKVAWLLGQSSMRPV